MKIIITENQLRSVQFEYLDYLFGGMHKVETKHYPDYIAAWEKDGEVILELGETDSEGTRIWVSYKIWDKVSDMFSLGYNKTQKLIKDWAEQHFEMDGIIPATARFKKIR